MATTRSIRKTALISNNWPNESTITSTDLAGFHTGDSATNTGSGVDWTIATFSGGTYSSGAGTYYKDLGSLTLSNTNLQSKIIRNTRTLGDLRIADSTGQYPASRCSVAINLGFGFGASRTGGGSPGANGYAKAILNGVEYTADNVNFNVNIYRSDVATLYQTGTDATYFKAANTIELGSGNPCITEYYINVEGSGTYSVPVIHGGCSSIGGVVTRYWEGADIIMNGSDSDHTIPAFSSAFTFSETSALVRDSGAISPTAAFTITEDTENFKIAPATEMGMVSSIAVTPSFIIGITKELSSTTEVQSTTENFVKMDPVTASSAFTFAVTPALIIGPAVVNIASAATTSYDSNMIYDVLGDYTWNQFSNNPFIITGYVKGGYTNDAEYEWDDLTTDSWNNWTYGTWLGDEGQWDQWPDNTWERAFKFTSNFTQADTLPILKLGGASAISSAFTITENVALAKAAEASLSSAFTITATSQGLIDVTQDLSSAFTLAVLDIDYKDDVTLSELGTLSAAFTTSFTGSIKYALDDTPISISSALTFTLATGSVKYDIENTPASAFTTSFIGHIKYDPSLTLSALASQLSVGLLLTQADPYNIITVDAETRTFVVPAESRLAVVQEENRLNIISSETRLENVLEETRVHKLKIPGLTNIYSTPRVRSET